MYTVYRTLYNIYSTVNSVYYTCYYVINMVFDIQYTSIRYSACYTNTPHIMYNIY